ncbi:hypothetical protein COY65_01220 [Candidatus Jorgensenbacteria bacterium CG_4_10_14_0_8_um_filter_39_13]|uniref:LTD domain-containing protein n=2 Tax=Candidatus Joergenseniibacteriota TaxID=1752739 RepID=A0A2M7RHN7_9BACT|nr:MAG: hypothetical protein COV54_01265 [Candidatus Jorgensenbacteria bacterium CG11_big_fil_rev_8_21_14_0_20_38_23]PIV13236.1 MAG: hypothetical protein COS46_01380 [Candidatus Jorgensenbacteria bacterium CG03_land_8_20_14_0_80_38_39]PIW97863.1 MAG: hypothetical protein COZ81_00240 [Candidatus Jorgensenbacteria bacterium CG_4_8_14_3_um_filter_38_10]PIY96243.1 MAG: hypothetical protein COY65_01220 [Candidatus Jorgensenbacteria bacterium CG_4_10_14_0_8_um_filter_39_13]PJA95027.1 MAG: hypothetica
MNKQLSLVIILFIIGFAIYFLIKNPAIFKFSFNAPLGLSPLVSTTTSPSKESISSRPSRPPQTLPPKTQIQESPPPKITPPIGFSVEQLSPDYQKVKISSVSASSYSGNQIFLRANYNNKNPFLVTGLRIKTNRGEIIIPQAVSDYSPSGLSLPVDIYLNPNGSINIYGSYSPIGQNLRLNKCLGYLNNIYKFSPTLPNNCPSIVENNKSKIYSLSGYCQKYIFSLGRCQIPRADEINFLSTDYNCGEFLKDINHRSCYNDHRFEKDFFSDKWWLWTATLPLDPYHDQVRLFDKKGLLINEYIY